MSFGRLQKADYHMVRSLNEVAQAQVDFRHVKMGYRRYIKKFFFSLCLNSLRPSLILLVLPFPCLS
jgi:hypothetical protein